MWGLTNAVKQFFGAVFVFFAGLEALASAFKRICIVADTNARIYETEADIEAQKKALVLNRELQALQQQALPAPQQP